MLDALSQVTGSPTAFKGQPAGTRALELADSEADSYFLGVFGRPERLITCECERSNEPSMSQVLHLTNGNTLNAKIEASGNRIDHLLAADDDAIVEDLYLSALSRLPTAAERQKLTSALAQVEDSDRLPALADLRQKIAAAQTVKDRRRTPESVGGGRGTDSRDPG